MIRIVDEKYMWKAVYANIAELIFHYLYIFTAFYLLETVLNLDPDPELITDPDHKLQLIPDPGPPTTLLLYLCQACFLST